MADMNEDFTQLIDILERSSNGSVALDRDIAATLAVPHRDYSTSVDAALSLLPDDEQWGVNWDIEGVHGGVCVYVWTGHPTYESTFVRSPLASSFREAVKHLPRLICIAALKAHSTLSEQGKGGGG